MKIKTLILSLLLTAPAWTGARETTTDLNNQAVQLYREGRYPEAEALYIRALAAPQPAEAPPEEHAVIKGNLGMTLRAVGRYSEAERLLTESLAEIEAVTGPASAATGHALDILAALYRAQGKLAAAAATAARAETMVQGAEGDANRLVLASIFIDQRRYREAEPLLKTALHSAQGVAEIVIYNDLATAAIGQGQVERAEIYARQAVDHARRLEPPDPVVLAAALANLGQAYRFEHHYAQAEEDYRSALQITRDAAGPSHPDAGRVLTNLAALYHDRGLERAAEDLYRQSVDILTRTLGPEHPQTLLARSELAEALRARQHYDEATALARTTLTVLERLFAPEDPRLIRAVSNYARLLSDTHHTAEAQALLHRGNDGTGGQ